MGLGMSEVEASSSNTPALQVHAMFERMKIKRVGAMVVVFDLIVAGIFFEIFSFQTARWAHVGVLFITIAYAVWVCMDDWKKLIRYQGGVIKRFSPGWYWVGVDGWVKRVVWESGAVSGELEMVSLSDQGGAAAKLAGVADIVFYVLMFAIIFPLQTTGQVGYIDARLALWLVFLVIFLKWCIWGNAFFAGLNRLEVDPEGWRWGGWSRRFGKSGRWEDSRVLIKPMTKRGRDQYFVVIGTADGSVGMIGPKTSVELIERAFVSGGMLTAEP